MTINVKFTYNNTAASPTLNINSTGAKPLNVQNWNAGDIVTLIYDGTSWNGFNALPLKGLGYSCSGNGAYSYFKICTLTINSGYINRPLVIEISQRGYYFSTLQIMFQNTSSTDPTLLKFSTDMDTVYYIKKVTTSTWEVYGKYSETYGIADLHRITGCLYTTGGGVSININMTNISDLPADCVTVSRNTVLTSDLGKAFTGESMQVTVPLYLNGSGARTFNFPLFTNKTPVIDAIRDSDGADTNITSDFTIDHCSAGNLFGYTWLGKYDGHNLHVNFHL